MEFTLIKVYLRLVLFMDSILLLKSMTSGGSQGTQDQNVNETKWNSICSAICLNSAVSLRKWNALMSHSYLPHRERGERGQCSAGGNCCSSVVFRLWQFSPAKYLSQEARVVHVKDFLYVTRFCFWIFPIFPKVLPQRDYFKVVFNMFLYVGGGFGLVWFFF